MRSDEPSRSESCHLPPSPTFEKKRPYRHRRWKRRRPSQRRRWRRRWGGRRSAATRESSRGGAREVGATQTQILQRQSRITQKHLNNTETHCGPFKYGAIKRIERFFGPGRRQRRQTRKAHKGTLRRSSIGGRVYSAGAVGRWSGETEVANDLARRIGATWRRTIARERRDQSTISSAIENT